MIDTPRLDPASERIEANLQEQFGSEVGRLDRAVATLGAGKAKLLHPDCSRAYGDAEHEERVKGLLSEFDAAFTAVNAASEMAQARRDHLDLRRHVGPRLRRHRSRAALRPRLGGARIVNRSWAHERGGI